MMDKETASNKLRKIKELAQRGVGGEKESALALYEKLKQKYEISEDEIFDELSIHWLNFSISTKKNGSLPTILIFPMIFMV